MPRKPKQAVMFETAWPPELQPIEVREAIVSWLNYRAERKLAPYTTTGFSVLLSKLAKWGGERTIAAIQHSMAQNYQGIYEERTVAHPATQPMVTSNRQRNIDQLKNRISR